MLDLLKANKDKPTAIDKDIRVQGLKNPTYLVIIGFTTRRVLEAVRSEKKHVRNVLIVEPDAGRFHATLKREYVGDLIRDPSIDFLVGVDNVELGPYVYKLLSQNSKEDGMRATRAKSLEVVNDPFAYPPVNGKPSSEADKYISAIYAAEQSIFLAMGCASDSFFRWERVWQNRERLASAYNFKNLVDQFKGIPAIVLGAGPSLAAFIEEAKKSDIVQRSVVIACDAALDLLLKNGIRPHFVTRCERKVTTIFKDITRERTKGVYYCAYPWTPPEYFDLFDDYFMLFRSNGICRWAQAYDHADNNGGVSSANAALELAWNFGCRDIVISGIDLCFIGEKSHVPGTEVEFDPEKSRDKWRDIPGNSGKPVKTIPVWERCLGEYQGSIHKYKLEGRTEIYNTSLDGAFIPGTKVKPWSELSPLFGKTLSIPITEIIKKNLERCRPSCKEEFDKRVSETLTVLKNAEKDLIKIMGFVHDLCLIGRREEEKVYGQAKAVASGPFDFFRAWSGAQKGLVDAYKEPARQVDVFRQKYYASDLFCMTVMDLLMMDFFMTENKLAAINNTIEIDYEKSKAYIAHNMNLFEIIRHYCSALVKLMETGEVDHNVDFKEIAERVYS